MLTGGTPRRSAAELRMRWLAWCSSSQSTSATSSCALASACCTTWEGTTSPAHRTGRPTTGHLWLGVLGTCGAPSVCALTV